jgi:hypothetical protein
MLERNCCRIRSWWERSRLAWNIPQQSPSRIRGPRPGNGSLATLGIV